ncbi:MAG: glycosyltransferase family 39 protein [Leptolyngbyaceae cyanobacterium bins.302]|nr:glycosyltransferase family 39 protein [Leptolyngbyaceae cyanobacterium bins.302]
MAENSHPPIQPFKLISVMRWAAIALLTLAVILRFVHLDRKVYWHDEVYTSMVITARPGRYLSQDLFQNKLVKPADLLAYQTFVPGLSLQDMIVRKGVEDVQHPPLYYVLLRFWAQLWGTDPAIIRGFSSLLSLLLFPALYGLCLELFASHLSGWIAIALFAVSPFHLVFAQEARQFGFWTALILASSALLLRAMRFPSWRNWVGYGLAMVIAFYTALFSLWIAVGHLLYVLLLDPENCLLKLPVQIGRRTIFWAGSLVLVGVLFIPWFYFIVESHKALGATTSWAAIPLPLLITVQATIFNFSRSFVDFNFDFDTSIAYMLAIPVLMLQAYAVYVLCRTAPLRIWWFVLTFTGVTALAYGLPDGLFGGQRFTVTRYLIPCFVGLHLAVVYLLTHSFTESSRWKQRVAAIVFAGLLGLGVLSSGVYTQANTWWIKVLNSNYHQVAELINESDRPLIVVDSFGYNPASMVSLSYLLKPETQFLLLPPVGTSFPVKELPSDRQTVFLFNLPEVFRNQFKSRYQKEFVLSFKDPWNEVWESQLPTPS